MYTPLTMSEKIGLIAALSIELPGGLRNLVDFKTQQRIGEHEVFLKVTGMGPDNACKTTREFIIETHPDLLLQVGFGGGIEGKARVNDLVVADEVRDADGKFLDLRSPHLVTTLRVLESNQIAHMTGAFQTFPKVVPAQNSVGGVHPETIVVETETYSVAEVARDLGNLPLIAIRAITDEVPEDKSKLEIVKTVLQLPYRMYPAHGRLNQASEAILNK